MYILALRAFLPSSLISSIQFLSCIISVNSSIIRKIGFKFFISILFFESALRSAYIAYTSISKDGDIEGTALTGGLGGGAQTALAKGYQNKAGTYTKDTDSYSLDANYNFKNIGLLLGARYTGVNDDANHKEYGYTDLYTVYNVPALKGLTLDISYQDWSKDCDGHDFWFKAIYKF